MSAQLQRTQTQRYTIELSQEYQRLIAGLIKATGLRTQKDVFESSLAILAWAVREVERGRIIASLDEATRSYAELQMPALLTAARRAEPAAAAETAAVAAEQLTVES